MTGRQALQPRLQGVGMGRDQRGGWSTDVWLTPPVLLDALGPFDLDPCAPADRPWDTANTHICLPDDGLSAHWPADARVWLNPPYGDQTWVWLRRLADHGRGTALVFARTETAAFHQEGWQRADAMLFLEGRVRFHRIDGTVSRKDAGAPSVLIAYGPADAERLAASGINGHWVDLTAARRVGEQAA
ncbi:Phage DNA modification methyltransferase (plasmid) [Euzebya pacifica]|uniref:Phage DNA modification methyltransferase n=1 Tax=Euzebya pacifica TaxID=1608957 RepID=A0A346Y692_9ACTN|nr:phage N-6-adenine-methyltransferase [Euzebya pacifica]AXV09989.1 Phage DNA modification methyltransferase [Euzebya pacifica]